MAANYLPSRAATSALLLLIAAACACTVRPVLGVNGFLDQFTKLSNLSLSGGTGAAPEGNPYGLTYISRSLGSLKKGNYLIANWNSADGNAGQGRSIIQMTPNGATSVFATIPNNPPPKGCNGTNGLTGSPITQVGLTMALEVLSNGWVIVGNTPIQDVGGPASSGCLIVLDYYGTIVETITGGSIRGPWGSAVKDQGNTVSLFVSMVLGANASASTPQTGNDGGYVMRFDLDVPYLSGAYDRSSNSVPRVTKAVVVAKGFMTMPGVSATNAGIQGGTVGPAGLVHDPVGEGAHLYIADTQNNTVWFVTPSTACNGAGASSNKCTLQFLATGSFLNLPIGLHLLPNGNLLATNGNLGSLVELANATAAIPGQQVSSRVVDSTVDAAGNNAGAGNIFNAVAGISPSGHNRIYILNDNFNSVMTLDV